MRIIIAIAFMVVAGSTNLLNAADNITVVVGQGAPDIEHLAAQELVSQFRKLFDANVVLSDFLPPPRENVILIGSPKTNRTLREVIGDDWPKVSDQGLVIRSFKNDKHSGLVVGGGSPAATLWSVYELGHHFGIRYVLREDLYPDKQPLDIDALDIVQEPGLKTRTWRTVNDFPIGPESWGLDQHKVVLRQLAKLKFNSVMLSVYPWQPFIDYEFAGVKKQTAMLWFGERYPINSDSPGRTGLGGVKEFTNPTFAGKQTYEEMTQAGTKLLRGIIKESKRLGMSVGVSITPLEFPTEFAKAFPGLEPARGLKNLTVAPGAKLPPDSAKLKQLVAARIRAYVETYPGIDTLYVTLPEFPEWEQHVDSSWKELASRIGNDAPTVAELIKTARSRSTVASGDRGESAIKGNIVSLAFMQRLFADSELLTRSDGKRVELVITAVDDALYPYLDRVVPQGSSTLNFIDYTARRVVENREKLGTIPTERVRSRLIMTLADDNVGVLSQAATRGLGELMSDLHKHGWDGFSTRYWMLAELDPTVYYLSRAAWDPKVTPRSAHDDLFTTITHKQSASDRLWIGFGHIEAATELTDKENLGFAFPVPNMLMKYYAPGPIPEWWEKQNEHYTEAMIELYRSRDGARPYAQGFLFYYAKRSEYVLDYLTTVKALREAANAKAKGDKEEAVAQLETALEAIYNAIDTLGDVVQDQSDRGLIAVLNAYGYRPILAEYEKLVDE